MTRQITFKRTMVDGTKLYQYKIIRLLNLPQWAILLGKALDNDQYGKQLVVAEQEGIDVILQ